MDGWLDVCMCMYVVRVYVKLETDDIRPRLASARDAACAVVMDAVCVCTVKNLEKR